MDRSPRETSPLVGPVNQTEQWTFCHYGKHFDKNDHTLDCTTRNGEIFCRTHKIAMKTGVICCILSNVLSPCNPSNCTLIAASTLLFDQARGLQVRRNTNIVTTIGIDQRVQPPRFVTSTETYQMER